MACKFQLSLEEAGEAKLKRPRSLVPELLGDLTVEPGVAKPIEAMTTRQGSWIDGRLPLHHDHHFYTPSLQYYHKLDFVIPCLPLFLNIILPTPSPP